MPGAHIAIDQDRPGPTVSTGVANTGRNDLWLGRATHPRSVNTASAYEWTLLDKPPGSTASIVNDTLQTCTITADLAGSYRIQLTVNGGGLGNTQVLVAAFLFDSTGAQVNNGWRFPAIGENPEEANFGGQTRGWDETLRHIFTDLLDLVTVLDEGVLAGKRPKLNFVGAGVNAVDNPTLGCVDVTVLGLTVQDEGSGLGTFPTMNFVGAGIQAVDAGGGVVQVSVLGLSVKDEGSLLGTFPYMDFAGSGVTTTDAGGGVALVTIPGLTVKDEGLSLGPFTSIDFVGALLVATDLGGGAARISAASPIPRVELVFRAGTFSTESSTFLRIGSRLIDLGDYPSTIGTLNRSVTFLADIEVSSGGTVGNVRLQNMTDNETVTGTDLTTSNLTSTQVSAVLTVGASAGNLKTGALYEVQVSLTGGGVTDRVSVTNARLLVRYA